MPRGVTNLFTGVTRTCQTCARCCAGSLSSHWLTRQEVDCGLSQNHVRGGCLCLKLRRTCMIPGSRELSQALRCWGAFQADDTHTEQHGQHLEWEGKQEGKVALFQNEDTSPILTLCPHFDTPPAAICEKLNAEREDGEKAHQPFISPPPKHHPCCCLCLPTPGT